jgi:hypothetical protein
MLKSVVAVKLKQFLENDRVRGFDLTRAPLIRIAIIRIDEAFYRAVITHHHIIADGWSEATILAKLFAFYQLSATGDVPRNFHHEYSGSEDGYKQFVEWTHTLSRTKVQEYWRGFLKGFSEPTIIPIIGKAKVESDVLPGKAEAVVSTEITQRLKAIADKNGFTISMILNAAWGLLLHKYSGSDDVVFGSVVSVRPPHIDVNSVGLFMNTVPVRIVVDADKPAIEVVRALYKQQAERSEHEHLSVAAIHACSNVPKGVSLMDSIFVVENFPINQSLTGRNSNLALEFVDTIQKTNFIISTFALFSDTKIKILLLYDPSFVQSVDATCMLNHFLELLTAFTQNPMQLSKLIPIITQEEKKTILHDWNQTYKFYPNTEKYVHHLVSKHSAPLSLPLLSTQGRPVKPTHNHLAN